MALNDFRCGAQNSVGIAAISDIKAGSEGLKSGVYDPISAINPSAEGPRFRSAAGYSPPVTGATVWSSQGRTATPPD
jgi:hypothetical protein